MAKSPDQIVAEIERKQNAEDLDLPRRAAKAVLPQSVQNVIRYARKSELDTDKVKRDTGDTTNPMGDKYKKGGKVAGKLATRGYGIARK